MPKASPIAETPPKIRAATVRIVSGVFRLLSLAGKAELRAPAASESAAALSAAPRLRIGAREFEPIAAYFVLAAVAIANWASKARL